MAFNLSYPAWVITTKDRLLYCRIAKQKLQKMNNVMAKWYKTGITQTLYNKLPARIKNRYSFTAGEKLTLAQMGDFQDVIFFPIMDVVLKKMQGAEQEAYEDTVSDVDLERDIT